MIFVTKILDSPLSEQVCWWWLNVPLEGHLRHCQGSVQDEPRLNFSQSSSHLAAACPPQDTGDVPFFANLGWIFLPLTHSGPSTDQVKLFHSWWDILVCFSTGKCRAGCTFTWQPFSHRKQSLKSALYL